MLVCPGSVVHCVHSWVMPVMVTFATFAVHSAIDDNPMEPSQAFTVVALMMMLR